MTRRAWRPAGPRRIRCTVCGDVVSTNALARAAHERSHRRDGYRYGLDRRARSTPDPKRLTVWRHRTVTAPAR